ncbi:uncharacterized protein JNUCC1_01096 [Lentibacillus sp. JNUCC-1]|uniref:LCP family protein n=1 Tax=Lentibacillus sp. JNUCC-1 TaxID=2654513 RepID=UPI0012E86EED|nr:LCP family protein [Lentibacillus sp. JNUCC-1]MUV37290.1 uncharacterized protein [Lentibacillus sp. JNUCC-1]
MSDFKNTNQPSETPRRTERKSTPKKHRNKKKLLLYIGIPIAILLVAGISYAAHIYTTAQKTADQSYEEVDRDQGASDLRESAVDPVEDNISVLILGIDDGEERTEDGHFRTDAMMLATFNKEESNVKLLSIPRDSYAYVPEVDRYTKINHAHHYGGVEAAIETVEEFLHVPVDYYVRVNFNAFIDTVDALGGIYYDVPFDMSEVDTKGKRNAVKIEKGYQKLDGKHALALARTRKYDSDIERGKRQQEIIKIIADEATSASSVFKFDDVMRAVGDNLKTNLTFDNMKSFLSYGMNNNFSIESVDLDGWGGYMDDGLWYYVVDNETKMNVANELRNHLDLPEVGLRVFQDDQERMTPPGSQDSYAEQETNYQENQSGTQTSNQTKHKETPKQPSSSSTQRHSAPSGNQTQEETSAPVERNQKKQQAPDHKASDQPKEEPVNGTENSNPESAKQHENSTSTNDSTNTNETPENKTSQNP